MSFPRYPKYKDSGVEWLGQVPEHWTPIRYKNVFAEKEFTSGCTLPAGAISFGEVVFKNDDALNEATKATYQEVLSGEFLINPINLNYDLKSLRTAFSQINTCVSPAYIVLKPKTDLAGNYFKYQLFLFDIRHMKTLGAGVRQTITFADIGACFTQMPPLPEQTRIAAFLDQETAKIDALVAEQERLMALLKEKRQAVISQAVTKGLNPQAALKPSGIEWLGDVPAHWDVKPLRRFSCLVQSGPFGSQLHAEEYIKGGIPVINPTNMINGEIVPDLEITVTEEIVNRLAHQKLRVGDVIFSRRGELGRCALVTKTEEGWLCGTGSMILRLHRSEYHAGYLSRFLSLDVMRQYFESLSIGSVMDSLSSATLLAMPMIVPPVAEQDEISIFISEESAKFDALTAEAQRAIDLLQERRTALISAAVTGQIDVRNQ